MGKQYLSVYTTCFFRCFLPKSTKYRTSSIFGTWCFTMLFWNFVLAYFLPLGDSFTVLMRRNCLKVLKLSRNSHWSQCHNIMISQYHNITYGNSHSQYHNITSPWDHHRHHQHQHSKFLLISFQSAIWSARFPTHLLFPAPRELGKMATMWCNIENKVSSHQHRHHLHHHCFPLHCAPPPPRPHRSNQVNLNAQPAQPHN